MNSNRCPAGSVRINSAADCQSAAALKSSWYWGGNETESAYPKGCYHTSLKGVYFNEHDVGWATPLSALICKSKGDTRSYAPSVVEGLCLFGMLATRGCHVLVRIRRQAQRQTLGLGLGVGSGSASRCRLARLGTRAVLGPSRGVLAMPTAPTTPRRLLAQPDPYTYLLILIAITD